MSAAAPVRPHPEQGRRLVRSAWDQLSIYLPIILMGLMALGTYWLARNTPTFGAPDGPKAATHDPDYFMRSFSVKTFDASGRLKSEVFGTEARHYPDTDTLEIDKPRISTFDERGDLTVATATRALSNGDASQVQLMGDAVVTRQAAPGKSGPLAPGVEFRSEFLHVFVNTERVKSNKPVVLTRGADRFSADSLDYDNLDRVMEMHGRVRGVFVPQRR